MSAPTFGALGVPDATARALAARGITSAFPIQAAAIPPALAGRDVCGRAPTGSGKTLAFGIPLIMRVGVARPHRPRALVLVPTRELAAQIADELRPLADQGQSIATFYGGVGFGDQLRALRKGVDVAIACPGRLADLIKQGNVELGDVDLVVLDEADRMADMGFLPEVKRLLDACAPKRQTLLFSATLDGDVDVIVKRYLHDPVRHEEAGADTDGSAAEHVFWDVERPERIEITARAVARTGPTVVFCRTKRGADRVAKQLRARGVAAVAIHGDRTQGQRERALEEFRGGRARAIVATDVAARGIHVDGVTCVIHFDPTDDPKDYVHRSGRTGRAGNTGTVISLVPREVRRDLQRQQRGLGRHIEVVAPDPMSLPEGPAFVAVAPAVAAPPRSVAPSKGAGPRNNGTRTTEPGGRRRPNNRGRSRSGAGAANGDTTNGNKANGNKASGNKASGNRANGNSSPSRGAGGQAPKGQAPKRQGPKASSAKATRQRSRGNRSATR